MLSISHARSRLLPWCAYPLAAALVVTACGGGDDLETSVTTASDDSTTVPVTSVATPTASGTADTQLPVVVERLRAAGGEAELFTGTGELISYVAAGYETEDADPEAATWEYLATFGDAYGIADAPSRFEIVRVTDTAAGVVVRLRQLLDGLPVFAGEVTITVLDGTVTSVAGVLAPDADVPEAVIDAAEARVIALEAANGAPSDDPELVVFSPAVDATDTAPAVPAWAVPVLVDDGGVALTELVVVSAVDGAVLLRAGIDATGENWDLSDSANQVDDDGTAVYDDATLVFETRGGSRAEVSSPDADASAAADNFATSWAYWFDTHGRDGHDGQGGTCDIYVHVGVDWRNASSNADCFVRIGDAQPYAQTLDVIAHELTHSVTGQTSGLIYEGQSGALNEHYSDFFAMMTDPGDWNVDLVNRNAASPVLDTYPELIVTDRDNGGVHTNSELGNHVSWLVGADGSKTHAETGVAVTGIGQAKTEALWYTVLRSLPPRVGYEPWACITISAARSMSSLTEDEAAAVEDAMVATELAVRDEHDLTCGYRVGGADPATPPVVSVPDSSAPDTTAPGSSVPATTVPPTTPVTTEPSCSLVGEWRLHDQEFFDGIMAMAGGEVGRIEYYSGDYVIQAFADGTTVSERRAWSFRIVSPQGAMVVEISSREQGTWSADDSTLSVEDTGGDAEVSLYLDNGGTLTPLPMAVEVPVQTDATSGTATYECTGDLLTLHTESDGIQFTTRWDRVG